MPKALTAREFDCLYWVALGKTNKEIGEILDISAHTVNFHLSNASRKLKVHSRQAAVLKTLSLYRASGN